MTTGRKVPKGARAKLRSYFLGNLGRVMDSDELRGAAGGISEWARRIRELRDEEGYAIQTHNNRADLKPGQYVLESANHNQPLQEACQKKRGPSFWIETVLLAKCAGQWRGRRTLTTLPAKHDYTLAM